ncbi:MAG: HK97-gp10 family putative phage morphogenesis protein [Candidatus Accumulibacter phosphatis]
MASNNGVTLQIQGVEDLKRALGELTSQLRKKVLLSALRQAARVVSADAKANAPTLQTPAPYRTKGLVRKRISVRTSKDARKAGDVGVFVNVRPAAGAKYKRVGGVRTFVKASQRGAQSPNDPFYWRFLEFGTRKMRARPFLRPAADKLPEALAVFEAAVIPAIEKFNNRRGSP